MFSPPKTRLRVKTLLNHCTQIVLIVPSKFCSLETRLEVKEKRDLRFKSSTLWSCVSTFLNAWIAVSSLPDLFLGNGMNEKFWKNSNCSFRWDLYRLNHDIGICFLGLSKSLIQRRFSMFKSCFSHFQQPRFGRTVWTKILKKILDVSLGETYRLNHYTSESAS